jgi:xylose isomerase
MREIGYDGWVAYDVFTRSGDNAEAIASTFEIMEDLDSLLDKIGKDKLQQLIKGGRPQSTYRDLIKALL